MANWNRPYLEPCPQKPHLYFAILGDFEWNETTSKFSEQLPATLSSRLIEAEFFRQGELWQSLLVQNEALAAVGLSASNALVLEGEVEYSDDLDYLQTTVDFLSFLTDHGGRLVYDPYTLNWFDAEDWNTRVDVGQLFSPFDHVVVLTSPEEDETTWFHTRGMVKFGRPDISVHSVAEQDSTAVKQMIDRFINFQTLGGVIEAGKPIKMEGLSRDYVASEIRGDRDDPDFNNCHVELK